MSSKASTEEIDASIRKLERGVGRSMTLQEEKKALQEIRTLRELKSFKERVQGMYDRIAELSKNVATLNATITELQDGVRRCELAQRISEAAGREVAVDEVVDDAMDVPAAFFGRIVGKGGSNLAEMQSTYGVIMDIDRKNGQVKITGTRDGIDRAKLKLEEICGEEEHSAKISSGLRFALVAGGFSRLHRLEEQCGVRIQVPREKKVAMIRGGARGVAMALGALRELENGKSVVKVATRIVSSVIGKGGVNFRQIRETAGVDIQVDDRAGPRGRGRDKEAGAGAGAGAGAAAPLESTITLWGEAEEVAAGRAALDEIIAASTEHEEVVEIPADMISWLITKGGARIQAYQREFNVSAQVRRPAAAVVAVGGKREEGEEEEEAPAAPLPPAVILVATRDKLDPAVEGMRALIAKFNEQNVYIELNSAQALALIGNRGEGVNKLRADTGAIIDVAVGGQGRSRGRGPRLAAASTLQAGQALVRVGGEPEQLAAGVAAVREVIDKFVMEEVEVSDRVIMSLLRGGGAGVTKLQEGISVNLDIVKGDPLPGAEAPAPRKDGGRDGGRRRRPYVPRGPGKIKVSGDQEAVAVAKERLQVIVAANYEVVIAIEDDEFVGSLVGKGGSNIKAMQTELGVTIDVNRRVKQVVCRGERSKAEAAAETVRELQARHLAENATVKVPSDMMGVLAGKGGSALRAIETDTGATLQTGRDGSVRIHCDDPDGLQRAVAAVKAACGVDKDVGEVDFDIQYIGAVIGRGGSTLAKLQDEFDVVCSIVRPRRVVVIRGDTENIAQCKARIRTLLREAVRVRATVAVPQSELGKLLGRGGANIRRLREESKASIDLPPRNAHGRGSVNVEIFGTPEAVEHAKAEVEAIAQGRETYLMVLTPEHVAAIEERTKTRRNWLEEALNAQITLHPEAGTVRINGDSDAVTNATRSLEQLLSFAFEGRFVLVETGAGLANLLDGNAPPQPARRAPRRKAAKADEAKGAEDGAAPASGSDLEEGEVAVGSGEASPSDEEAEAPIPTLSSLLAATEGVGGVVNTRGGYVTLWGEPDKISEVKSALDAAVATYAERHADVSVDAWMVPAIVGSRGSHIQQMEADTGARLRISERGSSRALVSVSGHSKAVVQGAVAALQAFVETLGVQESFAISSDAAGAIIGKGGSTIQRLQTETGAMIDVNRGAGSVTLRGQRPQVKEARRQIDEILEASGASSSDAGATINCHRNDVGSVVGKGGAVIRALQADTGAKIDIDKVRPTHAHAPSPHPPLHAAYNQLPGRAYAFGRALQWPCDLHAVARLTRLVKLARHQNALAVW